MLGHVGSKYTYMTYTWANIMKRSKRLASADIIVVIWPTLCLARPRPETRKDLRKILPISCKTESQYSAYHCQLSSLLLYVPQS